MPRSRNPAYANWTMVGRVACGLVGVLLLAPLLVVIGAAGAAAQSLPRLNEIVTINAAGITDDYGSTSDWIELHNPHGTPIDLSGWGLSDDQATPLRWVFPAETTLASGGYLVIFASGEVSVAGELHLPFSLAGNGEWIGLSQPDGSLAWSLQVPAMLADHSYGYTPDGALNVFSSPTPGSANQNGFTGIVAAVVAQPERGYYSAPVTVTLTNPDPAVVIRYTLSSSPPTAQTGTVYSGPISIDSTSTIRVAGFRDGWVTGRSVTHTYVFADDVPDQSVFASHRVNTAAKHDAVVDALSTLPTISLVTTESVNSSTRVETSVEWIDPDGGPGFHINAGMNEVGGHSVRFPKNSWRLAFGSEWGESGLNFPVFDGFDSNSTVPAVESFKRLTLRTGSHDTFFYSPTPSWMRNRWGDETMLELGHVNPHGRWVHVFLNGTYWGQYHLREHFDDHFMASYFSGDQDDYLGVNRGVVTAGSGNGWDAVIESASRWEDFRQVVDPVAYVDWMILNEYQGNYWDLLVDHNWRGAGPSQQPVGPPGFIFHGSDQDKALVENVASRFPGPGKSWTSLIQEKHPDFLALVNDRVQVLLSDGGVLTVQGATDRWNRLVTEIDSSLAAEYARWAGTKAVTIDTWRSDNAKMTGTLMPARVTYTMDRLQNLGLLSSVDMPVIDDSPVPAGTEVAIENPNGEGSVLVTVDGTDPRLPGGERAPGAVALTEIVVDRTLEVHARARVGGTWSALVQVTLVPIVDPDAPVIEGPPAVTTVETFAVRYKITAVDPNGDNITFSAQDLPTGLSIDDTSGIIAGTTSEQGTWAPVIQVNDGEHTSSTSFSWQVLNHDGPMIVPVVLNEYNAVKSSEVLADGGADSTFGSVLGNGGDWIELLVMHDGTDLRGWSMELWERPDGPMVNSDTIVFSDHESLADLAAGTIIVIAESQAEDLSYDPLERDWNLIARSATGIGSELVTSNAGNFDSNRHSFQIRLYDAGGRSRSPLMGETDQWRSFANVGGDEVFARCDVPDTIFELPGSQTRDLTYSSFGEPNTCTGEESQDLSSERSGFRGDPDCDGAVSVIDAMVIARYEVGIATAVANCSTYESGSLVVAAGDFNRDNATNVLDSLALTRCVVGIAGSFCDDG